MVIFEKQKTKFWNSLKLWCPVLLLIFLCLGFLFSINTTSTETLKKQQQTLSQAIQKSAVHTYALEGRYPESLKQILENYNITYDSEQFIVEYIPNGSNLFPSISVLPLNRKGGS